MMAKAKRLFCPPDKDAIGRTAKSPDTPNMPNKCLYSSSFFPKVKKHVAVIRIQNHFGQAYMYEIKSYSLIIHVHMHDSHVHVHVHVHCRCKAESVLLLCKCSSIL